MQSPTGSIWFAALLAVVAGAACGDDDGGFDGGVDSGRRDASIIDAPITFDSGRDGAVPDVGGPDTAAMGCGGACDPTGPSGCVAGVCVLHAEAPLCVPMAGRGLLGSACERTEQCAGGLACFLKRGVGTCGQICCGDDTTGACEEGHRCGGTGVLIDGTEVDFGECFAPRACDVLDSTACEPTEGCYIVSSMGDTDCREAGDAGVADPCVEPNDCQAGLTCSGFFEMTCARICSVDADTCPSDEGRCVAYAQSPEGTGLCTVEMSAR